jgi:hypothetical protein
LIYTVIVKHPEQGEHHAIVEAGHPAIACLHACEEFWDETFPDGGESDDHDMQVFIDETVCRCWEGRHSEVPTTAPVYIGGPDNDC